ncbi:MAG: hypothetical protein E6K52_08785 [Gammaproteobacteria bacterium]|nr:MAG: hypothetical protein E6K52_08785 [Gammaproteobacteria bacterium]
MRRTGAKSCASSRWPGERPRPHRSGAPVPPSPGAARHRAAGCHSAGRPGHDHRRSHCLRERDDGAARRGNLCVRREPVDSTGRRSVGRLWSARSGARRPEDHPPEPALGQAARPARGRPGRDARGVARGSVGPLQSQFARQGGRHSRSGRARSVRASAAVAGAPQIPDGAEDSVYMGQNPAYLPPNTYITSTTELLALPGFGRERYLKLAPFVTALPPEAKLNVCSASGMVLDAYTGQRSFGLDPEGLAKNRASANGCFPKKTSEYKQAFASPAAFTTVDGKLAETSSYFRLTSHVTIGSAEFNLYSLLYREGTGTVRPLLRSYASD